MADREERSPLITYRGENDGIELGFAKRVWEESKKLWSIVGPAAVSRIALSSMNLITQAHAGHLGELELASISIAITVVSGFSFGMLVTSYSKTFESAL